MHPRLSDYPHISSYTALLLLGYFFGYLLARSRAKHAGIETRHIDNLTLLLLVTGVLGARLFSRAFDMPNVQGLEILKLWEGGGLVFYGGLICSAVAVVAYTLAARVPLLKMLDSFAPPVLVGLALGRVGCFLAGCCWGDVCADHSFVQARVAEPQKVYQIQTFPAVSPDGFFLAVQYPERAAATQSHKKLGLIESGATQSAPVHPTQLYEAVLAIVLAGWMHRATRNTIGSGRAAALLCASYGFVRFSMEFVRADNAPAYLGMTLSQVISLCMMGAAVGLWLLARRTAVPLAAQPLGQLKSAGSGSSNCM